MTHHAATPERRGRVAYTRFVVGTERESPRLQTGVIAELRLLRETGNLTMRESRCVGELFDWFNQHLPQPPFVSSNWPEDAISWFKPGGQAYVDKLRR